MQYDRRMSIDRDGFLSPDIAEIRDRCRSQHRDSFEMITEINRVAQAVLPGFSTLQSTDKNSIACQLFIRALQSLQAAVLTAEIGLMSEAYTLIRSGLESVFYLGATIRTDDIKLKLMRDQVKRVRTVMEGFKRAIPDGDKYVNQDAFEEMLRSALPEGVDPATVSIKTFADQAGLTVLYDGIYRQLSLAHGAFPQGRPHVRDEPLPARHRRRQGSHPLRARQPLRAVEQGIHNDPRQSALREKPKPPFRE